MQKQDIRKTKHAETLPHIGMLAWRVEKTLEEERKSEINRALFMRPRLRHETKH